jgi:hypothetical protein
LFSSYSITGHQTLHYRPSSFALPAIKLCITGHQTLHYRPSNFALPAIKLCITGYQGID